MAICALFVFVALVLSGIAGIDGPVSGKPSPQTTFSGTVQVALSSPAVKLAGARVDIIPSGMFAITDSNGNFAITGVPSRYYDIVCSCPGYDNRTYENQYISPTSNYLTIELTPTRAQWLFMVYVMADTNFDYANLDYVLPPLAAGTGPTDQVKVVYVVDRMTNWSDAPNANARYYEMKNHTPIFLRDIGEVNMGNSSTLSDFMVWAESSYPALKTSLIIAPSHGLGWIGGLLDDRTVPGQPGVIDSLSIDEVQSALNTTTISTGIQLDVLFMDACLMQTIEVDYEMRGLVKVIVGSEDGSMWSPFDEFVSDLIANPSMDAAGLGTVMVNDYATDPHNGGSGTMSAIGMAGISKLASDVNAFADYLLNYLPTSRSQIVACRDAVQEYFPHNVTELFHYYIDIYDFVDLIDASHISQDPGFLAVIGSIRSDFNSMVIADAHTEDNFAESHGLTIYFPSDRSDYAWQYPSYRVIDFSAIAAPSWVSFVKGFFELVNPVAAFTYSVDHNKLSVDGSSSSDSDGTIIQYVWDFGDGVPWGEALVTHAYASAGTYAVTLRVQDNDGLFSAPVSKTIYVGPANKPPVPAMTYVANGLTVDFYDASSDSDGYIVSLVWSLGDGTVAYESSVTHTYDSPGTYDVWLIVYDDDGAGAYAIIPITVALDSPPSTPGVPTITQGDELDGIFTLTWTASVDADLTPVAGYYLMESMNNAAWTEVNPNIQGTSITLTRGPGSYVYCVCAFDTANTPLWSSWAVMRGDRPIVVPEAAPTTPGVPTITPGDELDGTFTLTWSASSDTDSTPVAGYWIIESVNNAPWTNLSMNYPGTSITLTRGPGSYIYGVCAFDTANPPLWSAWAVMRGDRPIVVPVPDSVPPVTTATLSGTLGSNGWYKSTVTVTLSATDSNGVKTTYYKIDTAMTYSTYAGPFQITTDGNHTVYFYSVDNKGYTETAKSTPAKVDKTSPTTTATLKGTTTKTVTLKATDTASGVAATYYSLDGGVTWLKYTTAFTVSGKGSHTVYFYSVDKAGNQETNKWVTFTI